MLIEYVGRIEALFGCFLILVQIVVVLHFSAQVSV